MPEKKKKDWPWSILVVEYETVRLGGGLKGPEGNYLFVSASSKLSVISLQQNAPRKVIWAIIRNISGKFSETL